MKKAFFSLIGLVLSVLSYCQKVSVEDDIIYVDEKEYCKIEKEGCGAFNAECIYYIKSLDGKKLFAVKQREYKDPDKIDAANRDGRILYLEYVFLKSGVKAETAYPVTLHLRFIDVARKVVKAKLIKEGNLDEEAVNDFVATNGTSYSERKKELASPKTIIIEK